MRLVALVLILAVHLVYTDNSFNIGTVSQSGSLGAQYANSLYYRDSNFAAVATGNSSWAATYLVKDSVIQRTIANARSFVVLNVDIVTNNTCSSQPGCGYIYYAEVVTRALCYQAAAIPTAAFVCMPSLVSATDDFGAAIAGFDSCVYVSAPRVNYTGVVFPACAKALSLQTAFTPPGAASSWNQSEFGSALATNGLYLLVGAPGYNNGQGAVAIWDFRASNWTVLTNAQLTRLGASVAIDRSDSLRSPNFYVAGTSTNEFIVGQASRDGYQRYQQSEPSGTVSCSSVAIYNGVIAILMNRNALQLWANSSAIQRDNTLNWQMFSSLSITSSVVDGLPFPIALGSQFMVFANNKDNAGLMLYTTNRACAPGSIGTYACAQCETGTTTWSYSEFSRCEASLTSGALAGIIVGSILGAGLLITAVVLLCLYWKHRRAVADANTKQLMPVVTEVQVIQSGTTTATVQQPRLYRNFVMDTAATPTEPPPARDGVSVSPEHSTPSETFVNVPTLKLKASLRRKAAQPIAFTLDNDDTAALERAIALQNSPITGLSTHGLPGAIHSTPLLAVAESNPADTGTALGERRQIRWSGLSTDQSGRTGARSDDEEGEDEHDGERSPMEAPRLDVWTQLTPDSMIGAAHTLEREQRAPMMRSPQQQQPQIFVEDVKGQARAAGELVAQAIRGHVVPQTKPMASWEIKFEDIHLGEYIGRGAYGDVWKATIWGTTVAVKILLKADRELKEDFQNEVGTLLRLRHPNIVLFMGAALNKFAIATEFVEQGSLYDLIQSKPEEITYERVLRLSIGIAKGMNYLHLQRPPILHRDLKSPNVLVDAQWEAKIADFGMSKVKAATYVDTMCGSPPWMAPEVIVGGGYSEACDVYGWGVVLWELVTKRTPYADLMPVQVIAAKLGAIATIPLHEDLPADTPPLLVELIRQCTARDPTERPSFAEVLKRMGAISANLSPMATARESNVVTPLSVMSLTTLTGTNSVSSDAPESVSSSAQQ
eukprot:TRINITY_DN1957_c0_g1_i1.p1 TRINITY_DN1957_c0_g1~~TRINITY_DN1957_c0_g1_i1.p1  ORF type:complete len:1000 (+),score=215.95 TRINITY_DN1957_c0_g1_i1:85-3084(+)